jgi:hypothetical protein
LDDLLSVLDRIPAGAVVTDAQQSRSVGTDSIGHLTGSNGVLQSNRLASTMFFLVAVLLRKDRTTNPV